MSPGSTVNEYQRAAFRKYGRQRRDPMFITAAILMELEAFPDAGSVVEHCDQVNPAAMLESVQWLFDGSGGPVALRLCRGRGRPAHSLSPPPTHPTPPLWLCLSGLVAQCPRTMLSAPPMTPPSPPFYPTSPHSLLLISLAPGLSLSYCIFLFFLL